MYCLKCGTQMPDESKFCRYCGTPVPGATAAAGLPENLMRALWAAVSGALFMALLIALHYLFGYTHILQTLFGGTAARVAFDTVVPYFGYLVYVFVIGCGLYVLFGRHLAAKIGTAVLTVITAILVTGWNTSTLNYAGVGAVFTNPILFRAFWNTLAFAAIVIVIGTVLNYLFSNLGKKQALLAAGIAVVVGFAYRMSGGFSWNAVFKGPLAGMPEPMNVYINVTFVYLLEAASIFLTVLFVRALCSLTDKRIRTGVGPKVWFGFVVVFNAASIVVSVFVSGSQDILGDLLVIAALTGLVMLWAGRRIGWFVYLLPVCLSIALNYKLGLYGAPLFFGHTGMNAPNYLYALPAFVYLVNPIITWLVTRGAWKAKV